MTNATKLAYVQEYILDFEVVHNAVITGQSLPLSIRGEGLLAIQRHLNVACYSKNVPLQIDTGYI